MKNTNDLYHSLTAQKPIIFDGGMGQELIKRMPTPATKLWSAQVLLDHPELIQQLHLEYIQAGARIITLNNYTCTPERLARDANSDLFETLHYRAIEAAQNARHSASKEFGIHDVLIAGCLPPLVASYHPQTCPEFENAVKSYRRLVDIQKEHVDLFICETMSSIHEAQAAVTAGQKSGLPIWVAFKLDDTKEHTLPAGESLHEAIASLSKMNIDGMMLNCTRPETIIKSVHILKQFSGLTGIYPNAFRNTTDLEIASTVATLKKRDDFTITHYADFMHKCFQAGIDILGGCCEITPIHIKAMVQKLST